MTRQRMTIREHSTPQASGQSAQISRHLSRDWVIAYLVAVDRQPGVLCESAVVVRVKMGKEVAGDAIYQPVLEGIYYEASAYTQRQTNTIRII